MEKLDCDQQLEDHAVSLPTKCCSKLPFLKKINIEINK